MMANSRNIDLAVGSDLGQARPDAWHLWCVLIPRRSITGRLVWGTVWRRDRGGRWVYKKVIEHSDGGELETRLPDRGTVSLPASVRIRLQRGKKLRKLIMCKTPDIEFSKLRISRAYIKLLCIPDGVEKIVSLARIGNYEVRMFESSQTGSDAVQLFSMELFDHDAQSPVDSCICYSLDAGSGCLPGFHFAMKLFEAVLEKNETQGCAVRSSAGSFCISDTQKNVACRFGRST